MVTFPFIRGVWYTFGNFDEFEEHLLAARRADPRLDADLRLNRQPWIKLRNEELYPAWHFCQHVGFPLSAEFMIGPAGAAADIEVRTPDMARRLQITTAGPLWPDGASHWGEEHMLRMHQLNQIGQSSGWGPYRRQANGSIVNRDEAINSAERDPAYLAGIRQALLGKRFNQHTDCELIVYANAYNQAMNLKTFSEIANTALCEVMLDDFVAVHVLAAGEGYIVSRQQSPISIKRRVQ
jgi:hypothetical protein